jgi:hypothetical protein
LFVCLFVQQLLVVAGRQKLLGWLSRVKHNAAAASESEMGALLRQEDASQVQRLRKLHDTLRAELEVIEQSSRELRAALAQHHAKRPSPLGISSAV